MSAEKTGTLVWCDVETTGLDDDSDILEVAAIITDDNLNEVARTRHLVAGTDFAKMNSFVNEMHTNSGLLQELASEQADSLFDVEVALRETILAHCEPQQAVLAGNSIHFDARMLRLNMPTVTKALSHRLLDVSSIRRMVRMETSGEVDPGKPACPHRALGDIETCIQEYKDLVGAYEEWVIEQHLANDG